MNKKVLAAVLALGIIASVGYFGSSYVLADNDNPMHQTLISRIAQKFNLKEADVEAVFEAVRDEKQEEMKQERAERLSQAVKDGVITEAQKTTLLAKMEEHIGERRGNRLEMQNWYKSEGIDETKLREYMRPEGMGMGEKKGMRIPR